VSHSVLIANSIRLRGRHETDALRGVRRALLFGCALFASWGAGLQNMAGIDLSKLFPLCACGLTLYWLVFRRGLVAAFPRSLNLFVFFVAIHTCITYGVFCREEFRFGYESVIEEADGFTDAVSLHGLSVAKLALFVAFSYATASLLRDRRELVLFSLFYGIGLLSSLLLGSRVMEVEPGVFRGTGGYLNPNSLGLTAMVAIFLCLFVARSYEANRREKAVAMGLLIVSLVAIAYSVSRSAIASLGIGVLVLTMLEPLKNKYRVVLVLCIVGSSVVAFLPADVSNAWTARSNPEFLREQEFGSRLPIWRDYLMQLPRYVLTGIGYERAMEVTRRSYTTRHLYIPHNTYLAALVEFGFIGLSLFLWAMWSLWKGIVSSRPDRPRLPSDPSFAGLLAAWAAFLMAGDCYGDRVFWLSWAVLAAYGHWTSSPRHEGAARRGIRVRVA